MKLIKECLKLLPSHLQVLKLYFIDNNLGESQENIKQLKVGIQYLPHHL